MACKDCEAMAKTMADMMKSMPANMKSMMDEKMKSKRPEEKMYPEHKKAGMKGH